MDSDNNTVVSKLWCVICSQYENKSCGHKSFTRARIDGSSNHKTSNIADHAKSGPHKAATMTYFGREQVKSRNDPITSCYYYLTARTCFSSNS